MYGFLLECSNAALPRAVDAKLLLCWGCMLCSPLAKTRIATAGKPSGMAISWMVGCFRDLDQFYQSFSESLALEAFVLFRCLSGNHNLQHLLFYVEEHSGPFFLCVEKRTRLCSYFIGCCILDIQVRHGGRTSLLRVCLDLMCRVPRTSDMFPGTTNLIFSQFKLSHFSVSQNWLPWFGGMHALQSN